MSMTKGIMELCFDFTGGRETKMLKGAKSDLKCDRILSMYTRLLRGEIIYKKELADEFHVNARSVQRDLDELRNFFSEQRLKDGNDQDLIYDQKHKGYRLVQAGEETLNNSEIFAICKILLESRSLVKEELFPIMDKLLALCSTEKERKTLFDLVANEKWHYIELQHGKKLLKNIWEISNAIYEKYCMEIKYRRQGESETVQRTVKPVGIMFSEYYFYLTAFIKEEKHAEDVYPTIYRIDRIEEFKILSEHFNLPYASRFEEGEFRKRIQFMYGGKLRKVKFRYNGPSIEAVLDRLPTAQYVEEGGGEYTVSAEVYGDGIEMWLRSQGEYVT